MLEGWDSKVRFPRVRYRGAKPANGGRSQFQLQALDRALASGRNSGVSAKISRNTHRFPAIQNGSLAKELSPRKGTQHSDSIFDRLQFKGFASMSDLL
jgi:hypothetical protein